jgi:hypothetical protein
VQIRKFLTELCERVEKTAKEEEFEGRVEWKIVDTSPTSFHAEIQFIELDGASGSETPLDSYRMVIKKRYYDHNIVSLTNTETSEEFIMQADPRLVISWLSF